MKWGGQLSDIAQCNYFPSHDLTDTATWRAPNLARLKELRALLISDYKCEDPPDPVSQSPSQQQQPPPPPQQQQSNRQHNGVLVLAQLDQLATSDQTSSADKATASSNRVGLCSTVLFFLLVGFIRQPRCGKTTMRVTVYILNTD